MFHLGVPTTRAASLIVSDETQVIRDKLYDGNAENEKCAVVMRVAPTFMRFGSFEIFHPLDFYTCRPGPSAGMKKDMAPAMLNYLVKNFFPDINASLGNQMDVIDTSGANADPKHQLMFEEIVSRTAKTASMW